MYRNWQLVSKSGCIQELYFVDLKTTEGICNLLVWQNLFNKYRGYGKQITERFCSLPVDPIAWRKYFD